MKFSQINCPECGARARGIIEKVMGCALLNSEDNDDGTVDYSGQTDVWWQEQIPIHDEEGRVTLICPEAHEWQAKEIDDVSHTQDSDCTVDEATGSCTGCGVVHGDPCPECEQRGYHAAGCSLSDATKQDEVIK